MKRCASFLLTASAVSTLSVVTLWSQSFDTGILGTVSDSSGAIVVGAAITITQPATGTVRMARTAALSSLCALTIPLRQSLQWIGPTK